MEIETIFQKAGEICENCRDRWDKAKKSPMIMEALPTFTMRYHLPIAACPYCDGPIRSLSEMNVKKRADAAEQ